MKRVLCKILDQRDARMLSTLSALLVILFDAFTHAQCGMNGHHEIFGRMCPNERDYHL